MDSLNRLIFTIFGRDAADYLGGAFMFVIYGGLFLIFLIAIIWIEKKFFPKLREIPWARFIAIMLSTIAFWYLIPWFFWTLYSLIAK